VEAALIAALPGSLRRLRRGGPVKKLLLVVVLIALGALVVKKVRTA